jgi:hypothetical protein
MNPANQMLFSLVMNKTAFGKNSTKVSALLYVSKKMPLK